MFHFHGSSIAVTQTTNGIMVGVFMSVCCFPSLQCKTANVY